VLLLVPFCFRGSPRLNQETLGLFSHPNSNPSPLHLSYARPSLSLYLFLDLTFPVASLVEASSIASSSVNSLKGVDDLAAMGEGGDNMLGIAVEGSDDGIVDGGGDLGRLA
jgi:hypothetical protein